MPVFEMFSLVVLAMFGGFWWDSFKARDAGIQAARIACESEGLQLLDDTVALGKVWPARSEEGQLLLQRIYGFEYSDTGDNRRRGSVVVLGHQVLVVNIGLRLVPDRGT